MIYGGKDRTLIDYVNIFKTLCRNRYFELEVAKAHQSGRIDIPIYLSIGQDHIPAIVAELYKGQPLFIQHRCHSLCLSWGISPESIAKELLGRKDGCNKGMGGSASLASKKHNVFGHSGLLGDQIPIATGYAQSTNQKTICVLGDAAAEEDYALASFGYAATHNVPILFICEDNGLSILTEKETRRSWDLVDVAESFGVDSYGFDESGLKRHGKKNISATLIIEFLIEALETELPGLINIQTKRHMWHAGSGQDEIPKHDVLDELRRELNETSEEYNINIEATEHKIKNSMEKLWKNLKEKRKQN